MFCFTFYKRQLHLWKAFRFKILWGFEKALAVLENALQETAFIRLSLILFSIRRSRFIVKLELAS